MFSMRPLALPAALAVASTLLSGCALQSTSTSVSSAANTALAGTVHGGQPGVSGARVYLYAVGSGGYGSASISLLKTAAPGVTVDGNGNAYVLTDGNGNFNLTGTVGNCPTGATPIYLLALGGNPGLTAGTNNTAISLMAGLGSCNSLSQQSYISINEVTTAATITALQQFMVDTTHIGSSAANAAGLQLASAQIANLVSQSAGTALSVTGYGNGKAPQQKLNTLGDVLAPCINSQAYTSGTCGSLFAAVTPSGTTAPVDVAAAMLLIAKNPGYNVANVYKQINAAAPFQPNLATAPNDFSLEVTFNGGGLSAPGYVAIDAAGNAWLANCPTCLGASSGDSVVGFGPNGQLLSGTTGFTAGIHKPQALAFDSLGSLWSTDSASTTQPDQVVKMNGATLTFAFNDSTIANPQAVAIDSSNNAWVTNPNSSNIVKINAAGTRTQAPVTSSGFIAPAGIAIDGTGILFAAGAGSNSILKFNSAGTVLSPAAGYTGGGLNQPSGLAIDGSDTVWTVNNTSTVTELNGMTGAPTSGSPYGVGISNSYVTAIDGLGTAWFANCRAACGDGSGLPDNVLHVSATGTSLIPTDGLRDAGLNRVGVPAIDPAGNLWVSNNGGGSVTVLIGVAAPVLTPLAAASAANKLGVRP